MQQTPAIPYDDSNKTRIICELRELHVALIDSIYFEIVYYDG